MLCGDAEILDAYKSCPSSPIAIQHFKYGDATEVSNIKPLQRECVTSSQENILISVKSI